MFLLPVAASLRGPDCWSHPAGWGTPEKRATARAVERGTDGARKLSLVLWGSPHASFYRALMTFLLQTHLEGWGARSLAGFQRKCHLGLKSCCS